MSETEIVMGAMGNDSAGLVTVTAAIAARSRVALAALMVAVVAAGCSGGTGSSAPPTSPPSSAASPAPTPEPTADPSRPEGPWTFVAWVTKRSDTTSSYPTARVLLTALAPTCDAGPCDLTMTGAGTGGGYREPEAPVLDGGSAASPATLTWDGTGYRGAAGARTVSCNLTGRIDAPIEGGYSVKRSFTLTYVPPQGDQPARMHGTTIARTTATKAGKARGCTDFVETETLVGTPTGALDPATPLDGSYDASLSSTRSVPKNLAPVGQSLWLGRMTAASGGGGITGLGTGLATLEAGAEGWSGAAPATPFECRDRAGTSVPKGADATESFADLHPVALDGAGKPIFAGTWTLRVDPTAVGLKRRCSLAVYEGRIYLVPHVDQG